MKSKATLLVETDLADAGKKQAARAGTSVSQFVTTSLDQVAKARKPLFGDKWFGHFSHIKDPDKERLQYLRKRYL